MAAGYGYDGLYQAAKIGMPLPDLRAWEWYTRPCRQISVCGLHPGRRGAEEARRFWLAGGRGPHDAVLQRHVVHDRGHRTASACLYHVDGVYTAAPESDTREAAVRNHDAREDMAVAPDDDKPPLVDGRTCL